MTTPDTEEVAIPLATGATMAGALARPPSDDLLPGMLVLHELYGLNDDIRRITSRFAEAGYVSLAPDLYSNGPSRGLCLAKVFVSMLVGATGSVMGQVESARSHLAGLPGVDAAKVGVVGFCMGGGFALAFSTTSRVAAAGVNYGSVPRDRAKLQGACPVVASYGALDSTLRSHPARLEAHLTALGVPHDVKVYPDAGHSFLSRDNAPGWMEQLPLANVMHAGYVEDAAEDAWSRMLAFFEEHLKR